MYIRKNNKMIILLLLLTILVIATLLEFIAANDNKNINDTEEKTQIVFLSSWGGSDTKASLMKEIIEDFEKENKDIEVVDKSICNDEFLLTIKTDFAQGKEPDVFGLWPGSDIELLINADKVADLTGVLDEDEEWKDSFKEEAFQYDISDNKIYGLPFEIIYECLFINKDIFEEYNVDIPKDYYDLVEAVKTFNDSDIIPIAYNATPEGTYLYQNIVMKLGGKYDVENPYYNGEIKSNYIEAMYYMKELYDLGAFPENAFTIDDKTRNDLFLNKKAAMIVQGSWFIGEGGVNTNDDTVIIIPFPTFNQGKSQSLSIIYGIGGGNFHMSQKAYEDKKKKEACTRFMKYITSKEVALRFTNELGCLTTIDIEKDEIDKSILLEQSMNLVDNANELVGPTDSFLNRTLWEDILVERFPNVLEGNESPEEVFKEMNQ
ncbi:MAG: ABC transporter substrate-binding protein [Clostridiaceae bacterium]